MNDLEIYISLLAYDLLSDIVIFRKNLLGQTKKNPKNLKRKINSSIGPFKLKSSLITNQALEITDSQSSSNAFGNWCVFGWDTKTSMIINVKMMIVMMMMWMIVLG